MIFKNIYKLALTYTHPLIAKAPLLYTPIHCLATDRPVKRDHYSSNKKKFPNEPNPTSHGNNPSLNIKPQSPNKTRKLCQILQSYRQILEGSGQVKTALSLCRKVTRHYTKDRINQFKTCKPELERLVNSLSGLPFKDLTLTQNYNVLNLLRVMQETQLLKRNAVGTVKDLIFMSLQPAFRQLDRLPVNGLCSLYVAILPFNHPHLAVLADQISNLLGDSTKELDPLEAEAIIVALQSRAFLSAADFTVLKAILSRLQQSSTQLPLMSLARIYQAMESMGGPSLFGDIHSIICLEHFYKVLITKLEQAPFDDPAILFLIQADFYSPRQKTPFQIILKKTLERLEQANGDSKIVKILVGCLQRAKLNLNEQQIDTILTFLSHSYKDQTKRQSVFSEEALEIVVLYLFQCDIFDKFTHKLQPLIKQESFDVKWSLIMAYSLRNIPFPIKKLQSKIKPKTTSITLDSNFIKSAASIGIQHSLHPGSSILSKAFQQIKKNLQQNWIREKEIAWMGRQCSINPQAIKSFHSLYNNSYKAQLEPYQIVKSIHYYQYFITCQNSTNYNPETVRLLSTSTLQFLMEREHWNNKFTNSFLLYIIHRKLHLSIFSPKSETGNAVARLILHCSRTIHKASRNAILAYHNLLLQTVHFYQDMKGSHMEIDLAIKRMLLPPTTSPYHESQEHKALIAECLKKIYQITDPELIVSIIRAGMLRNKLKGRPDCKFKQEFLSDQEIEILNGRK